MRVLKIYTGDKTYMYPNGALATPQKVLTDFPAILTFKHVIETDENEEVLFGVENFSAMKTRYNIGSDLSDEQALEAISTLMDAVPEQQGVSDETRIADALEDLVVLSMPDEEE